MKITKIKKTDTYALEVSFDNNEVRLFDCSDRVKNWFRDNNKDLIRIAENFTSAHIDGGNLAFKAGKNTLCLAAKEIYSKSKLVEKASKKNPVTTYIKRKSLEFGTISSQDVMNTVIKGLPFTGDWKAFLGEPTSNFYMILSAQPGHGKSTFCLKFGNYLTKFGRVLYVTNEEDAGRIKSKLKFINDRINDFDIAFDCKNLNDVISLIEQGKYDFVFIDSAQYGGMDYRELRLIREKFPKIGMVAICRQTKTGTARGSQEKEYDGDITIKFDMPGHAVTVKNRFWELSDFQLF